MRGVETVRIGLQYSRAGITVVGGMVACTLAVTFAMPLEPLLRAWIVVAAGALALEAMERVVLLSAPHAIRALCVQRCGAIEVERASGASDVGVLRPGSFVAPWMVIVRWRRSGAWCDSTVLVLPDMAPAEELRRLRVLLRWSRGDA